MKSELIYDVLNRALEEEIGLAVECSNPQRLSNILHEHAKDQDKYASLVVVVPSLPDYVFLTKRSVELDEVSL